MVNDMYDVKYRQTDTLYESVFFESCKQIRISHALFKMASVIDLGHMWYHFFHKKNM